MRAFRPFTISKTPNGRRTSGFCSVDFARSDSLRNQNSGFFCGIPSVAAPGTTLHPTLCRTADARALYLHQDSPLTGSEPDEEAQCAIAWIPLDYGDIRSGIPAVAECRLDVTVLELLSEGTFEGFKRFFVPFCLAFVADHDVQALGRLVSRFDFDVFPSRAGTADEQQRTQY